MKEKHKRQYHFGRKKNYQLGEQKEKRETAIIKKKGESKTNIQSRRKRDYVLAKARGHPKK